MNYMVLVNKVYSLKQNMELDLIFVGKNSDNEKVYMERKAGKALMKMLNDVNSVFGEDSVIVDSGYRSLEKQQKILDYYFKIEGDKVYSRVALPGYSEHHTGLAIDLEVLKNGVGNMTGDEKEMKWLYDNAYKYGFILRYPQDKENITGYRYEPWHFRYVGSSEVAFSIKKSGLTFDEYVLKSEKKEVLV